MNKEKQKILVMGLGYIRLPAPCPLLGVQVPRADIDEGAVYDYKPHWVLEKVLIDTRGI